jgi:hypothetical protein
MDLPESMIDEIVSFYYKEIRKNLSSLDVASHIRSEHKFNLSTSMNISTYFNSSTKLTAKKMKVIAFAAAMLVCSLNAVAQNADGFYSEVAYSNFSIKGVASNSLVAFP